MCLCEYYFCENNGLLEVFLVYCTFSRSLVGAFLSVSRIKNKRVCRNYPVPAPLAGSH